MSYLGIICSKETQRPVTEDVATTCTDGISARTSLPSPTGLVEQYIVEQTRRRRAAARAPIRAPKRAPVGSTAVTPAVAVAVTPAELVGSLTVVFTPT